MISDPIHCPSCKQTNPANSNFCNVCGAALPSVPCPQCGEMNDVGTAMQCRHCGGALLDDGLGNLELGLNDTAHTWDGRDEGGKDVPSGVYIYWITIGKSTASGTLVVVR